MGDFNVNPQGPELQPLNASYHDAWNDATQIGRATGPAASKGTSRVDYLFYLSGPALTVQSAEVVDTAVAGIQASDHQPVVATFTVR